jgi:hypothetical protein
MRARALSIVLPLIASCPATTTGAPGPVEFNRDIRPILSDKCFGCHGPDSGHRKAGLRLDLRDAAMRPAKSGEIPLKPGDAAGSHLLERITSTDKDEVMPPPEAKMERLTKSEVETLRRWIAEGAEYQPLWSFIPLKPLAPAGDGTAGASEENGIDRLVRARLKSRALDLRKAARPEALLRRVSLDLTGLPPSSDEVRAFLADGSPDAYKSAVERLLSSPAFGERMASDWLDVARYSDSFGFQVDRERPVWPWRDWVVDAFNKNMPFDQFTTWQLAGDLLPGATQEQVLATAFNRLHQQESEGGSIEEEYRVEYVSDRVQTFATAFLGLTFECAKCHDHKFDPITQREFYQMFAFFDDIDEAGLYSFFTGDAPTPAIRIASVQSKEKARALEALVSDAEKSLREATIQARGTFANWLENRSGEFAPAGEVGRYSGANPEGNKLLNITDPSKPAAVSGENKIVEAPFGKAVRLSGDDALNLSAGSFNRPDPFTISLWMQTPDAKERAVILHRSKAWTDAASRGFELLLEDGKLKWSLIRFWPGDAASIRSKQSIKPGEWLHVAVSSDGSGRAAGLQIFINGKPADTDILKDNLSRDINPGRENITLGERMRDRGFKGGIVGEVRVFNRLLSAPEIQSTFQPRDLQQLWSRDAALLTDSEREQLYEVFVASAGVQPLAQARENLKKARTDLLKELETQPEIMVMKDLPSPKKAYVLFRGQYDQRRDEVEAGTPASLPPFPSDAPRNRLGLAKWLTAPGHPLLARVTVNRFWQALFGRGLVRTSDDFGSQGSQPEYQEVLDWLSLEFVKSGWNTKELLKRIVLSKTYMQESTAGIELITDDPENVMLARGPRFRLPAEAIRDTFLYASGLLSPKTGGAPVKPYEVSEAFRPASPDAGEGSLRRSLYTRWLRTSPPPAMMAFDASRRAVCSARRERTNTPLQALVLLNGPQYVEAARALGSKLYSKHGGNLDAMIEDAFLACLSRFPDEAERRILSLLYAEQLAHFQAHPDQASALLKVGKTPHNPSVPEAEAAAAAVLAQALFNHDGSVVKQ